VTIYTNSQISGATHSLSFAFGSTSGTIATNVGASVSWTPPLSLADELTNATAGACIITCQTYYGGTLTSTRTCRLTLSIPDTMVPTISSVVITDTNDIVVTRIGKYVKTLSKLNSSSAKKASSSSSDSGGPKTERLDWFKNGKNKIPKGATFKVKDVKTGKIFTCKRWSGYNHLDAEPLTANDTKIMKSIYGHWSWRRRAILVKYDGHVYAASMNGMPHGTGTIKNNNFDGHFCIHFYKSKTHGSNKVDSAHQNCVATAMKYSW
jgi:hypothetical protein